MDQPIKRATIASAHRAAFSERLKYALLKNGYGLDEIGPTLLARLFNSHYPGPGIGVHSARKWLTAEALPTHEKLATLANMLQVAPAWLTHGTGDAGAAVPDGLSPEDARLLSQTRALDKPTQRIVRDFVTMLSKKDYAGDGEVKS